MYLQIFEGLPLDNRVDILVSLRQKEGTIGGESYRGRYVLNIIKKFLIIRAV